MPAGTTITINDGAGTPVATNFDPVSIMPSKSILANRNTEGSAGFRQMILGFSPSSSKRKTNRVSFHLDLPCVDVVDGVESVRCVNRAHLDVVIADESTGAERDDVAAFIANALSHATIQGYIADLDPMF